MQILCLLRLGPVRLGQLSRAIPGASKKVLAADLRRLESAGLLTRRELSGTVRRVEYQVKVPLLTPLITLLDQLEEFGRLVLKE